MTPKPGIINTEQRVDVVDRLMASHNSLAMPWAPSLYQDAADEIIRLRKELHNP